MARRTIDIRLGTKYDGSGIASLKKGLATIGRNLVNIQAGFQMASSVVSKLGGILSGSFAFERQTAQFKTLIGGIDEAKAHMADLKALGDTPPFSLDQFAAASRSLMVMTDGALGYKKSMEMIGDAAAAVGAPIEEIGHAVGRLYATVRDGQPIGRAAAQLRNVGILTPEIVARLDEMQKSGKSSVEIWTEIESALKRYNGAMDETKNTGEGLIESIKTRWNSIVRAFGDAFSDAAKDGMGDVLDKMTELEESGAIESWANATVSALNTVAEKAQTVAGWFGKIWNHLKEGREAWKEMDQEAAEAKGDEESFTFLREEQVNPYTRKRYYQGSEGSEQVEVIEDMAEKKKYEKRKREEERLAKEAARAAEEEERKIAALKAADQKRAEENAKKAEDERKKAGEAAAKALADAMRKHEDELHKQRMDDIRDEIDRAHNSATQKRSIAEAAQSEFDRAFAMYRDPTRAAEQIGEERAYAADLNRLHRDANRYGGKWRIDELSSLMSAGDTQGVASALEGWRKSSKFTPEVEAMVRASAAERTKTTAEDELRKIESNTAGLAAKLDELISMKGA